MTIYALATITHETAGQGSCGQEERICRMANGWELGEFPPAFTSKEAAETFRDATPELRDKVIVPLELRD